MAATTTEIPTENRNGIEALLPNGVNTINDKPAAINGLRKFKNPPSWQEVFVVVYFNKVSVFSKRLNYFHSIFFSLFVKVIPETWLIKFLFKYFSPSKLILASTRISLFIFYHLYYLILFLLNSLMKKIL